MLLIVIYHYALKIEQLSLAFDNYEDNFLHVCIEIILALEKNRFKFEFLYLTDGDGSGLKCWKTIIFPIHLYVYMNKSKNK